MSPSTTEDLIYLASPYTHSDPAIKQWRFEAVCREAGILMNEGFRVYAPIAHSHPIALRCNLPLGWKYWQGNCEIMVRKSCLLIVTKLPGWDESIGIRGEVKIADDMPIDVEYREPKDKQTLAFIEREAKQLRLF